MSLEVLEYNFGFVQLDLQSSIIFLEESEDHDDDDHTGGGGLKSQ